MEVSRYIPGMTDRALLAQWVRDARDRTIDLVDDLSDDELVGPLVDVANPLIWEIGHLAWFEEKFVLRQALGEAPLLSYGDSIWDSGAIPHDTRWRLVLPSRSETIAYMHEVGERVAEHVLRDETNDVVLHFALYSVFHYDWHTEAITYTRQTRALSPPKISVSSAEDTGGEVNSNGGTAEGDVQVPGTRFLLGATRSQPFAYDNEKWAHPVEVASFAIARAPVTQTEYRAFVEDGGYQRRELWRSDGWEWREAVGAEHPLYWRASDGVWHRRHFDAWVPLEPHRPVVHVNWYEADAYTRWSGRRLPTEAEWELAATGAPAPAGRANVDWVAMDTVDVGAYASADSAFGCRQMFGNVWEWTATTFDAYPNFERDAYWENSQQFFGSRKVLRGGSWATRSRLVRPTLRNYFTCERRDPFTGFRTCPLEP